MFREVCFPSKGKNSKSQNTVQGVVAYTCNPNTETTREAGNHEFHANLSHTSKPCFKNKKRSLRVGSATKCNCCFYRGHTWCLTSIYNSNSRRSGDLMPSL